MKFSTAFIVCALATSSCIAKKVPRKNYRRKTKEDRKLSLSYLVNHDVVEEENNKIKGRASFQLKGDQPIVGVYFKPIYADSDLNNFDAEPKNEPIATGPPIEAPATAPPTAAPSVTTTAASSKAALKRNGVMRNGVMRNGDGTGGGLKRNGTGRKMYVVRHKTVHRNGGGNGGGSKSKSKSNSKSNSKSKAGKKNSKGGGSGTRSTTSECRQLCADVPFDADPFRAPVCDASSMTTVEWMGRAEENCCCSEGISYLRLVFDTMFYSTNFQLGGTFSVVKPTVGAVLDTTVDIASTNIRGRARNGNMRKNQRANAKKDPTPGIKGPGIKGPGGNAAGVNGPPPRPPLPQNDPAPGGPGPDDPAADGPPPPVSPTEIGRVDGSAESIFVVDCMDNCLSDHSGNTVCMSARETHDQVVTGTEICIVQLNEFFYPRFDWKFPTTLTVMFESTVQERFLADIDTSCGLPAVSPWAAIAFPEAFGPSAIHINTQQPQSDGFNFPIFTFSGGMSTGAYDEAMRNPFKEAGYQLGLEQCGCDCADYPPTEAPTMEGETNTLPPTIDFSCSPTAVPEGSSTQVDREEAPIGSTGTETEPPTVVFSIPDPLPQTDEPTRKPVAPPTSIPTQLPTATPTFTPTANPTANPTAKPTQEPTVTKSEPPSVTRIASTMIEGENTCSEEGAKSIYDYICRVNNFSNFCRIIKRAGLVELMDGIDENNEIITLFAPTNRGCKSLGLTLDQINIMDTELLKHIVMTHATAGKVTAESLVCDSQLPTLEGTFSVHSTKCFPSSHAKAQIGFFNSASDYPMILSPNNIDLCNGYIQPVNNMIQAINF